MDEAHKELVKRLRDTMNWGGNVGIRPVNQDGPEAADALEALAGEVENLRHDVARHMGIANAAEAERDELANWKASFLHENEQILASNAQLAAERDRLKAENDLFYAFCNAAWSVGGLDVDWIRLAFINPLRVYKARKALGDAS